MSIWGKYRKDYINDFLEDNYISKLKGNYSVVEKTNLPNGIYLKHGGGYQFYLHNKSDDDTGFVIITNNGIKGFWSGQEVFIKNGLPVDEDIYKIMARKDLIREEKLNELLKDPI